MANANLIHLQHSSESSTNTVPTAPSTSVSGAGRMVRLGDDDFESHVKQLVEGFEALNREIQAWRSQIPSFIGLSNFEPSETVAKGMASVEYIRRSMESGLSVVDKGKRRTPTDKDHKSALNQSLSKSEVRKNDSEIDFTTQGKESDLGCPFASMGGQKPLDHLPQKVAASTHRSIPLSAADASKYQRQATSDPITAELYSIPLASPPPSIAGSASKCPIRFLDQHSPEEVAQYFESHKHELPRSHEICVKRYQSNEESIRQLDAKYGNLVSMIQGLGVKHRRLMPAQDHEGNDGVATTHPDGRVERWAQGISGIDEYRNDGDVEGEKINRGRSQDRDGNADRLLKEVRVGESPSRPWGIPIPPMPEPNPVANTNEQAEVPLTPTANPSANTKRKACPLRNSNTQAPQQEQLRRQNSSSEQKMTSPNVQFKHNVAFIPPTAIPADIQGSQQVPQMVFTGPVFIGYPIEQAMALIQQLNCGVGVNARSS